jgi:hypothetical protein
VATQRRRGSRQRLALGGGEYGERDDEHAGGGANRVV